jgi:hypothetical protein
MMKTPPLNFFRPYVKGDIPHLWGTLRHEDRRELAAAGFTDPEVTEKLVIASCQKVLTWDTERGAVAVCGVTPEGDVGLIWSFASRRALPRWRWVARRTEGVLQNLGKDFKVLANFKDVRNKQQIEWLTRLGFTFIQYHEGENTDYVEFVRIMK